MGAFNLGFTLQEQIFLSDVLCCPSHALGTWRHDGDTPVPDETGALEMESAEPWLAYRKFPVSYMGHVFSL